MRSSFGPPEWTASLDAITARIAEKLPGWRWRVEASDCPFAGVYPEGAGRSLHSSIRMSRGTTPPLALCHAFALAMAAQAGEDAR